MLCLLLVKIGLLSIPTSGHTVHIPKVHKIIYSVSYGCVSRLGNSFHIWVTQCDQMAFKVFIICPFTTMRNCPIVDKIYRSQYQYLPNIEYTLKKLPKTFQLMPKWRNFAKFGHTGVTSTYLQLRIDRHVWWKYSIPDWANDQLQTS